VHETFLDTHSAALVLVVGTFFAGALLEWLVPFRELATEGRQPAGLAVRALVESTTTYTGERESDKGTKRLLVSGMTAGLFAGWLAARYVPRHGASWKRLALRRAPHPARARALPRIRVEEAALEGALGQPYRAYGAETARLVPGVWSVAVIAGGRAGSSRGLAPRGRGRTHLPDTEPLTGGAPRN
jgi:protein-S-isoprenylcysteine O-methyltransferase Ste14